MPLDAFKYRFVDSDLITCTVNHDETAQHTVSSNTTQIKKKDGLLNAHLSNLEFIKIKKLYEVMKALEKSFQTQPIPLLQLNSFGYSIEKSAPGSKIGIVEKVLTESKAKVTCQLQCYAVAKPKELGKWDCAQIKDL